MAIIQSAHDISDILAKESYVSFVEIQGSLTDVSSQVYLHKRDIGLSQKTYRMQPIPLGVTFSNAVSKLKAQISNVSFK